MTVSHFKTAPLILLTLFGLLFCPSLSIAKGKFSRLVNGSFANRYRLRTTGGVTDQDAESLLTVDVGDPSYQKVTAALQAGGIFDLNGKQAGGLNSIYDTFNTQAVGRLYYGHVSVQKISPLELVRVGRQHNLDFESFYFDGVTVDSRPVYGVRVSAYGGVPVHLFENQFGFDSGDYLAGTALSWTPVQRLRIRFDFAHLRDSVAGFRTTQANLSDNLLGMTVWMDILKNWDTYARFTTFSDQLRDVTFASTLDLSKYALQISLRAYRLLEGYDVRVPDFDIYGIAGTYQPYTEVGLTLTKGLGRKLMLDTGFNWRKLDTTQTTSAFNHGYEHAFAALSTVDLFAKGLKLSGSLDYYHGNDTNFRNNYFGGSFSASREFFKKRLNLGAGTAYYLYHFNFATGNESDNVQIYYASAEAKLTKVLRSKLGYEFENSEFDKYHNLNLSLIWDF